MFHPFFLKGYFHESIWIFPLRKSPTQAARNAMIDAQAKRLAEMQNNEEARVEGEVKKKEALEGFIFLNISIFFSL